MVEVRKANKIIKIPEEQVEKYLLDGYKKIDKKGNYIKEETKESKEMKLFDKNGYLVEILAENKEFYFVRKGYELGAEYTTWAGTKQQDIERINYALMKKEDYWSSKPKYIDIKNT